MVSDKCWALFNKAYWKRMYIFIITWEEDLNEIYVLSPVDDQEIILIVKH